MDLWSNFVTRVYPYTDILYISSVRKYTGGLLGGWNGLHHPHIKSTRKYVDGRCYVQSPCSFSYKSCCEYVWEISSGQTQTLAILGVGPTIGGGGQDREVMSITGLTSFPPASKQALGSRGAAFCSREAAAFSND